MKGYLRAASLALLVACYATTATAQSCGIPADRLAHPTDCSKYYQLSLYSCPDGLLFNAQTDQCESPANVVCGEATEAPSTTTDPPTTGWTDVTTDVGTTAQTDPPTTGWTVVTTDSGTTIQTDPPTTGWTDVTTDAGTTTQTDPPTTSWGTVVTTDVGTTIQTDPPTTGWTDVTTDAGTTTQTDPPTTVPTVTTTFGPTFTTEVPTTTDPWVTTVITTTVSTPSTTTGLPTEGTPDPNGTTTSSPIPTEGTTTLGTTVKPEGPQRNCPASDDPNNRVRYAHESECHLYYLCENGVAKLYQCVKHNNVQMHFNPYQKICQPVNEAGCDRCPDVEVPGQVVRLPHESICEYYYRCEVSGQSLYRCPTTGDHFSRIDRLCLIPEQAWCGWTAAAQLFSWRSPVEVGNEFNDY